MQAKVLGVERYALSRLEGLGNIERLAKGVYRMGGSPSTREEDVLVFRQEDLSKKSIGN